MEAKND